MKRLFKFFVIVAYCLPAAQAQTTPPRDVWGHSCYTYKDMNMNGAFDMGDKPYANLRLEITRPDGTITWRNSNIDGFANLNASLGNKDEHVYAPGVYDIRAIYPEGWQSLSSTDQQRLIFVERRNSGGRLVPLATCKPIGVAPILSIRGRLVAEGGEPIQDHTLRAISFDGAKRIPMAIGKNGYFTGIGSRGQWRLFVENPSGKTVYERDFEIEHGAVVFSDIMLSAPQKPELDVAYEMLSFDDLLISDALFEIPAGYGGLKWLNWISVHNRFYKGEGYVNMTLSSEYVAYNSSGVPAPIWSDQPFDFKGVYIGMAWPRGEEDEVVVRAWRGEELAHKDILRLTDNGPVFFDAGYEDITRLEFSSGNYERIVLDNFQYKF